MKKFILAAVVLVGMSVQAFAGPIITISIEFGHKDINKVCIERGLCDIRVGGSRSMTASINDNTGTLDISINKTSLSREIAEYQFSNGIFEVPVDYILTSEVCSQLGIDKFTVKAGKYAVTEKNGIIMISLVNKSYTTIAK
ncbi:MAG: hypothetical protein K0S44_621 [Bacteroidetes bacterium]|jgi:hypothetical protein|nr:hypothetical protein [Bacteroidota bacterium]